MKTTQQHQKQVEDLQNLLKDIIKQQEEKTKRQDINGNLVEYLEIGDREEQKKKIEDLENQLKKARESIEDENAETSQKIRKLKEYTDKNGNTREKREPEEIERATREEILDKYLYSPLKELIENDDYLDLCDYIRGEKTPGEIIQKIEDEEREIIDRKSEFIYYYDAIKYLEENDQSLQESLELAKNMGYDLDHLNSCILASLLFAENEDLSGEFEKTMEILREKAEEMEETREETQKKIEKEIEEETPKAIAERRTPEDIEKLKELKEEQQTGRNKSKDIRKIADALREFKHRNNYIEEN